MANRVEQYKKIQNEAIELFIRKNADYGDSFAAHGPIGVIIRMSDKINRLTNMTKTQVTLVETETLRDTLLDLYNYSAMALMLIDND